MSGIYIPGMEMPKGCFYCIFNKHLDPDTDMCRLTRDAFDSTFRVIEHRRGNCPLVPVPEHGDLIDKRGVDVLSWNEKDEGDFKDGVLFVLDKLDELPVVLPADKEGKA